MLILFFDSKGVIHHKYVPEDQTVNATFYIKVFDHLCKRRYCPCEARNVERSDVLSFPRQCPSAHCSDQPVVFGQRRSGTIESPSIFAIFKPSQLFRSPKMKIGAERWPLCFDRRHSEICNRKINSVPVSDFCKLWNGFLAYYYIS